MHRARAGVKALNVEFLAAELVESDAIVLSLLLTLCFCALPINTFIFLPA